MSPHIFFIKVYCITNLVVLILYHECYFFLQENECYYYYITLVKFKLFDLRKARIAFLLWRSE